MANKFTISTTFKAHDRMTKTVKNMTKATSGFSNTLRLLKYAIAGGIVFKGFQFLTKQASRIEDAAAAFTPLMGGVEKANKLVDALNKTAATTPFQFENISKTAMQLLPVMNQDIEKTISTFRMLGDTAGGSAQKLDSIARGFTKAMLKGKPDMEALNMIAEAGVPIFSEMAKSMGISKEQLFEMSKAGKLTTKHLTKTFRDMTREGGIFYKGMEISSKTLTGKLSTFWDNIKLTAAALGKNLLPILKPIIDKLIKLAGKIKIWIENNQDLIRQKIQNIFKKIADAARFIWEALQKLNPFLRAAYDIFVWLKPILPFVAGGLLAVMAAQWALNAAMAANPIGAVIISLEALILVAIIVVRYWKQITTALRSAWNWINNIFNNPVLRIAMSMFAQPLLFILGIIQTIVDLLSGKGWKSFLNMTGPWKGLMDALGITKGSGQWGAPISPNVGIVESRQYNEWSGELHISGAPPGSTYRQKGKGAPKTTMDLGPAESSRYLTSVLERAGF